MNALILAAGYATRMGALTLDRPKALLPVGGVPFSITSLKRSMPFRWSSR